MPQDVKIRDMGIFPYGNVSHNVAKLLRDVDYPVAKAELARRYGNAEVQVDFDRKVPFASGQFSHGNLAVHSAAFDAVLKREVACFYRRTV